MAEALAIRRSESLFDDMTRMQDRIMRRANEIFQANGCCLGRDLEDWLQAERELVWRPAIELQEKDDELQLEIAVPGVDPKDLDIEVTPGDVLIKAELHHEHKEKEKDNIYTCEFASGNLFRSVHLPKKIDPDKVKAEVRNGVLTLKAQIAQESKTRKVAVAGA